MNIALIGYGKMGKIIEEIAVSRGHTIMAKSNSQNPIEKIDFSEADVAIEFTVPHFAVSHIEYCVKNNTPVVVGTTAWNDKLPYVKDYVTKNNGCILYASNFSIGVNIFFDINRRLSKLMNDNKEYKPSIQEIHHLEKIDAPSGTAITIANDIISENENLNSWVHNENTPPQTQEQQVGVTSFRVKGVPGTHTVEYKSEIDDIKLSHVAHNRRGFALGAVIAAEWIQGKKGIYTMQDVIN